MGGTNDRRAHPAGGRVALPWGLALVAAGVLVYLLGTSRLASADQVRVLPPVLVAAMFAAAQVLRLPTVGSRDDHRVAAVEVPILLAIFFAVPSTLTAAAMAGTAAGLVARDRRLDVRHLATVGAVGLASPAALAIYHEASGALHAATTRNLLFALAAGVVARLVLVTLEQASAWVGLDVQPDRPREALVAVATTTPLALVAVAIGHHVPSLSWIVLLPLASHLVAARDRVSAVRELHRATGVDPLTGIGNRHALVERLATTPTDTSATLAVVDLDGFRRVNDELGTAAGDDLLRVVAARLGRITRDGDLVARLGGDEFGVLLLGADGVAPETLAERVGRSVREPVEVAGVTLHPEASVGVVRSDAAADDRDELLARAQLANREAKRRRRGGVVRWEPWMSAGQAAHLALRADLVEALDGGHLQVHVQPFHELGAGAVVGGEALVRWVHPERGFVSPAEFIPLAEDAGLIDRVGSFVLARACDELVAWDRIGARLVLSVNISAAELMDDAFVDRVRAELERTGADPSMLMLEITERDLLGDVDLTLARLAALKALGVRLAIDDFGTGYSSLAYLQRFPVDVIKVAKEFVDAIEQPSDGGVVARAVIDLAHALGMRVLAEAVETPNQHARLAELGCDLGQGWLWSRAAPTDEVIAKLGSDGWDALGARRFDPLDVSPGLAA